MPNYVRNNLTVCGGKNELEVLIAFLKQGKRNELDFNLIVPEPKTIQNSKSPVDYKWLSVGEYLIHKTFHTLELRDDFWRNTVKTEMENELNKKFSNNKDLVEAYIAKKKVDLPTDTYEEQVKNGMTWFMNLYKYGVTDWYNWALKNWGTKWNACSAEPLDDIFIREESSTHKFNYGFETAWSMPNALMEKFSQMFPHLSFTISYADEDMGQNTGKITYKAGKVIDKIIYDDGSREAIENALAVWNEEYLNDYICEDKYGNCYIDWEAYDEAEG